jgi:hypothetical protein
MIVKGCPLSSVSLAGGIYIGYFKNGKNAIAVKAAANIRRTD